MEIERFDVSEDQEVTLIMTDMPKTGVRTENTIVYIKGAPLGKPNEVSGTNGTIVFSARNAVSSGRISVKITLEDGNILRATSTEDYEIPAPVEGQDQPFVKGINPRTASKGTLVTLTGNNLSHVTTVGLRAGSAGLITAPVTQASEKSVQFRVPMTAMPSDRPYPVVIRTETDSSSRSTTVSLKIDNVG